MASRKKATLRDFNRRRSIILNKTFDMVFYQRGTNLSKCLFQTNPRDVDESYKFMENLLKKRKEAINGIYFQQKQFLDRQSRCSIEPSVLMERSSGADIEEFERIPRYRRPKSSYDIKQSLIPTLMLARPCLKNKFNLWEEVDQKKPENFGDIVPSVKEESVFFESAIPGGASISKDDHKELFSYWYQRRISSGRDDSTRRTRLSSAKDQHRKSRLESPLLPVVPVEDTKVLRPPSVSSASSNRFSCFITQSSQKL